MRPFQLAIIADDLTGAADAGIAFSRAGLTSIIALGGQQPTPLPTADVYVINTHSRHLSRAEATTLNLSAAQTILPRPQSARPLVYQKIDSTLRGHPAASLLATMQTLQVDRVLVAPAFPTQKRTTIDGVQLVDGEPLHATPFGVEVQNANLLDIFQTPTVRVEHLSLQMIRRNNRSLEEAFRTDESTLFIADAVSDTDLRRLAQAALASGLSLYCGSAGLAHALAAELALQPQVVAPRVPPANQGPVLICAGSRHPRTRTQIDVACLHGAILIEPTRSLILAENPGEEAPFLSRVQRSIAGGEDVLLTTATLADLPLTGQQVAARLAALARQIIKNNRLGGLILTGGDTAMAVCRAIGAGQILLQDEIEAGIASGRIVDGPHAGKPVVTKAGGFGSDSAIADAVAHLRSVTDR